MSMEGSSKQDIIGKCRSDFAGKLTYMTFSLAKKYITVASLSWLFLHISIDLDLAFSDHCAHL